MNQDGSCALALLRTRRFFHAILAAVLCVALTPNAVIAQCQYEITGIIQAPPCAIVGPPNTFPAGMSEDGKVVGRYEICGTPWNEAFLWTPNPDGEGGTFETLPRPEGVISATASDVNSAGYVIGAHVFEAGGTRGYIFNPNTGEFRYLEALDPTISNGTISTLNAINESNVVVGSRRINPPGSPGIQNAVIWHPYGENGDGGEVVIDLGDFGVGPNSSLQAVNSDGTHFVGWTGHSSFPSNGVHVLDGVAEVFGAVPTTESSTFRAVSDTGVIAAHGVNLSMGYARGALLTDGTWHVFEPPPGFQTTGTVSGGLNNLGQALVSCSGGGVFRPHLWQHGGMTDLVDLVDALPETLLFTHSKGLNDAGQVLVRGTFNNKIVGIVLLPLNRPLTDLNIDCVTDVYDLFMFLESWGACENQECAADFTGDGRVGVPDLLVLLANWG